MKRLNPSSHPHRLLSLFLFRASERKSACSLFPPFPAFRWPSCCHFDRVKELRALQIWWSPKPSATYLLKVAKLPWVTFLRGTQRLAGHSKPERPRQGHRVTPCWETLSLKVPLQIYCPGDRDAQLTAHE